MNWFFITLGLSRLSTKLSTIFTTIISLFFGIFTLIYFNETTIFLTALLVSVVAIRAIDKYELSSNIHNDKRIMIDKTAGIWFALSVAPATHISLEQITLLENGFLIQAILSFILFIYLEKSKISIIGRIYRKAKGSIATVGDDIIAGFIAGILSLFIWQAYIKLQLMI